MGIADAISAWTSNGGTLQLLGDCEYDVPGYEIGLPNNKVCTLELNGQSLHINVSDSWGIAFNVGMDRTLIINDSEGGGSLTETATSALVQDARLINAANSANVTVNGGTFSCNATNPNGKNCYVIEMNTSGSAGTMSITGGIFESSLGGCRNNVISGGKFKIQPNYSAAVLGKVFALNDGYYTLVDGSYFATVNDVVYSDTELFNAVLSEDANNPTEVVWLAEADIIIPASKYVVIRQNAESQNNGKFTNNGTVTIDGYQKWDSGEFTNNGNLTIITGIFKPSVYSNLAEASAVVSTDSREFTHFEYADYKQILENASIVATVGNEKAFRDGELYKAIEYSSEASPVMIQKDNARLVSFTISDNGKRFINLNNHSVIQTSKATISKGSLTITGAGTMEYTGTDANFLLKGSSTSSSKKYSVLTIDENVTLAAPNAKASCVLVDKYSSSSNYSYGVEVNIKGIVSSGSYALYINGNVKKTTGSAPIFNIFDGASIESGCEGGACIYAAGYGKWTIGAATLKAATPIYSKAGILEVNGATIKACGAFSNARPNGNGFFSTGDGIVLDSKAGYAGNMQLLVTSATITSENAYAIQEVKTESPTSQTINMTIQHGSLAGQKGALAVSDDFAAIAEDGGRPDGTFVVNAVIGGKYSTKPTVIADGYEAVQIYGQEPFMWEVKAKTEASYTTKEFAETSYDEFTVPANEEYVVKNGQTITIGKLTIGNDADSRARVRVEPTGKLIIGEGGIAYNNNKGVESLLLESSNSSTGILMFNGASKLTSSILGTVEMYAHTRIIDAATNEYLCQHFGLPLYVGGASIEKNAPAAYGVWNVQNGWENVHSSYILNNGPWDGNNVTTNTENEGSLFKFKGCLVGNVDATYNFTSGDYGYKFFGNSYTAPMKMTELMNQYAAKVGVDGSVWDGTVWVFKPSDYETMGQHFVQWNGAEAIEENAMIDPLQGFFLRHESNEETSFTVEYSKAVLGYSTMGAEDVTVENKGKITITDGQSTASLNLYEGEGLSDDFDFNYDGYQMETGTIQIYVTSGGQKWSSFGSNSFDGKEIVIVSKANTEITMSFSKLGGNAFKLTDKASGAEVEVAADKTYKFTVEPNSTVTRFKLGEGEVSAEEADADAVKIWVAENNLNIAGAAEGDAIEVINLAGIKVLSAVATGEGVQTISLSGIASGAYIVKAGAATVKFVK